MHLAWIQELNYYLFAPSAKASICPLAPGICRRCVLHVISHFFLPEHMRQGNLCAVKVPVIKYPYLSLSDQIISILKSSEVKALLDEWRTKPCKLREYANIFNDRMCYLKLKALDDSLFFFPIALMKIMGPIMSFRFASTLV